MLRPNPPHWKLFRTNLIFPLFCAGIVAVALGWRSVGCDVTHFLSYVAFSLLLFSGGGNAFAIMSSLAELIFLHAIPVDTSLSGDFC